MRFPLARWLVALAIFPAVVGCSVPISTDRDTAFRFDDEVGASLEGKTAAQPVDADKPLALFDGALSEPWSAGRPDSSCRIENGAMDFAAQEADAITGPSGMAIDGTAVDSLLLEMGVTGTDRVSLQWRIKDNPEFEAHRIVNVYVSKPGVVVNYVIQVAGVRAFRHREIDQFRLSTPKGARIVMKSLRVVTKRQVFSDSSLGIREYSINNRIRPCLFMHCPGQATYEVNVPERGRFSTGLGVLKPSVPVTFRLLIREEASEKRVWEKVVDSANDWDDVVVDFGASSGRKATLVLKADCGDPTQVAFWSSPVMYQARKERKWYERGPQAPYNVVVYVIDCLRADHLDAYGYGRKTGPNIAKFGLTGARFLRHYSQETWTKPSMSTLATGVPSFVHGINAYGDVIPDSLVMLPGILRRAGYVTCAISENPHTPPDASQRRVYCYMEAVHLGVELNDPPLNWNQLPDVTFKRASEFMESHRDAPFFLYVHTMEPHDIVEKQVSEQLVYDPPEPFRHRWASRDNPKPMDFYDECIAFADSNFKRFLDKVEDLGLRENTLIILMADHGEAFGEHEGKMGHAGRPYNELIHIPLFVSLPGVITGRRVVDEPVQLLDIPPTILDVLGLPEQEQFQGLSLLPLVDRRSQETYANRMIVSTWAGNSCSIQGRWKVFDDVLLGKKFLFDLASDPGETRDVATGHSDLFGLMAAELSAYVAGAKDQGKLYEHVKGVEPGQAIDVMKQEQLEALGYLGAERTLADKKQSSRGQELSSQAVEAVEGDGEGEGEGEK